MGVEDQFVGESEERAYLLNERVLLCEEEERKVPASHLKPKRGFVGASQGGEDGIPGTMACWTGA